MATQKFNPVKLGFKRDHGRGRQLVYSLYKPSKAGKVWVGWIAKSTCPKEVYWTAYKVIYHEGEEKPSENWCFKGRIPNNTFAKQLFKNIF